MWIFLWDFYPNFSEKVSAKVIFVEMRLQLTVKSKNTIKLTFSSVCQLVKFLFTIGEVVWQVTCFVAFGPIMMVCNKKNVSWWFLTSSLYRYTASDLSGSHRLKLLWLLCGILFLFVENCDCNFCTKFEPASTLIINHRRKIEGFSKFYEITFWIF